MNKRKVLSIFVLLKQPRNLTFSFTTAFWKIEATDITPIFPTPLLFFLRYLFFFLLLSLFLLFLFFFLLLLIIFLFHPSSSSSPSSSCSTLVPHRYSTFVYLQTLPPVVHNNPPPLPYLTLAWAPGSSGGVFLCYSATAAAILLSILTAVTERCDLEQSIKKTFLARLKDG